MEALSIIIEKLMTRIDYILNNPPHTERVGNDLVTSFDGKKYKNLSAQGVGDLWGAAYYSAYSAWKEAWEYEAYLQCHYTPSAENYLRLMREKLITKKRN